ncbi:uncharacterized protein YfiM (DUF2279 family) [Saonia flava]|uniref:Uncharacterized protein YfiM (DUF2279 family) n=1 Tax=Saonia flava TaxID=523696 RepID=A0A846QN85_9FLAO|nr:hypothetical protein [Saonia flava]NJB70496.1 uncharacterized protein YfiM (DUF2279 family) [Saonia flava]
MKKVTVLLILLSLAANVQAQVERDKALHFVGGTLYGLAGAGIAKQISDGDRYWTFAGAIGGSLLIGVAKESIDNSQYGGWSNEDLLATVLGGTTVGFTIDIFTNKKRKKKLSDYTGNDDFDFTINQKDSKVLVLQFNEVPTLNMLSLPFSLKKIHP